MISIAKMSALDRLLAYGMASIVMVLAFRLFDSFNLDETGLVHILRQGFPGAMREYTTNWPMLSLFEIIMWPWMRLSGNHEFLVRLPAFLFFLGFLLVIRDIGCHLAGRRASLIFPLIALATPQLQAFGTTARPYSLALLTSALCLREVLLWQADPREKRAIKAGVWLALSTLTRFFAIEILPLLALFMAYTMNRHPHGNSVRIRPIIDLALPPVFALITLLPVIAHFNGVARLHSFAGEKSLELAWHLMIKTAFVPEIFIPLTLIAVIRGIPRQLRPMLFFFAALAAFPVLLNLTISFLGGRFLISEKYINAVYSPAIISAGIMSAGFSRSTNPRLDLLLAAIFLWITFHGTMSALSLPNDNEDWRRAFSIVKSMDGERSDKILLVPGFFENQHMELVDLQILKAPATAYNITSPVFVVPKSNTEEARQWVANLLESQGLRSEKKPIFMVGKAPCGKTAIAVAELLEKKITGISFTNTDVFMIW